MVRDSWRQLDKLPSNPGFNLRVRKDTEVEPAPLTLAADPGFNLRVRLLGEEGERITLQSGLDGDWRFAQRIPVTDGRVRLPSCLRLFAVMLHARNNRH